MPIAIRDRVEKKVKVHAVVGNSMLCGHCREPLLEGKTWLAFDEPYCCLVHEGCMGAFEFNELPRTVLGKGTEVATTRLSEDERTVGNWMRRPWFQKRVPPAIQDACKRVFLAQHQRAEAVKPSRSGEGTSEAAGPVSDSRGEDGR